MRLRFFNSLNYPQGFNLIGIAIAILIGQLLLLFAMVSSVPAMLIVAALIYLTLIVLLKKTMRVYILIILVPIAANFSGLTFRATWATASDILPIFPWFAIVSMVGLLIEKSTRIREYDFSTQLDFVVIFFVFWALISVFWASDPYAYHTIFEFSLLFVNFLLFYLIATLLKDENLHRNSIIVFIVWGFVVAVLSIVSLHFLEETYKWTYALSNTITFEYAFKHSETRIKAIMNPNLTALFLNLVIAFSFCLFLWLKKMLGILKKFLFFLVIIFLVYGVLETKSKAGIGSMILMFLFFLIVIHTLRRKFVINFFLSLFILVSLFIIQTMTIGRTPRILESEEMSLEARLNIWKMAMKSFISESHGWGLGIGGLIYYRDPLPHAHSIYFSTIFDLGLVGFILLSGLIIALIIKLSRLLSLQETYPQMMLVAAGGGFVAMGIQGIVDFSYMQPIIWLFLGITMATFKLVETEKGRMKDGVLS
ncbi:MAG: O-antigen ligase family protein [Candidatus Omnitrophica bacterium]|nr:O-antigen ligase family protein [Candidatus Omnitrophota bacterium]